MILHVAICQRCKDIISHESDELYENYREICFAYCMHECPVIINPPEEYDQDILYTLEVKRAINTHQNNDGIYVIPIGHFKKSAKYHTICPKICKLIG